ncbi:DUF4097 family beta strand repeat-containing protein [uncultured Adlercreutzia sp.]|uniref:DUF4097 family beta strand repeat-containing protein n=1 Tax=uncultured Adlercreutzia sp. TaxID=875803 RepID=UPI002675D9ED|nr:DUF4097 family beta strand repeat-containing protein [uncultured Adlercreutzia sp.]
MKLATSTWVKVALIGLLCLGVCGWLGGCSRGMWFANSPLWPGGVLGCAGINVMDGALSDLGRPGSYETTTEGTRFEADASEVSAIELNWLAGSGYVWVASDDETGGKVIVEETVRSGSCPVMVCEVEGGVLSVSYMEGNGGLSGCSQSWFGQKDLTVTVPASLADQLELFELEAASGRYTVEDLSCVELEMDVASGEANVTGVTAERASLSKASGRISLEGVVTDTVELDQASGATVLSFGTQAPSKVTGSSASGSVDLVLPVNTRVEANVDKTTGSFANNLGDGAGANGDADAPTCSLDFDILSGSFTVNPAE